MIAASIIFTLPKDTNWEEIKQRALDRAAHMYAGMPGLKTKGFVFNKETGEYGALYFWENRKALDNFLASDYIRQASEKLGKPSVHMYEVAAYIQDGKVVSII